jgi:molybdopterin-guanine dinucleotide biosynthesis protein A
MDLPEGVVGILLAGGRSSRMGGGDKCLLTLAGQPLLAHVIGRLRPQVSDIVINANGDLSRFAPFGLPLVPDRLGDHAGPLAGVHAGMDWALANRSWSRFVITAATDTPFFPVDLVSRFCSAINGDEPRLLVAQSEEGVHQVFGLWPLSLAPDLEDSLKRGLRKVGDWVRQHGAEEVSFPALCIGTRKIDPFFNINRPEHLAEAEAFLQWTVT